MFIVYFKIFWYTMIAFMKKDLNYFQLLRHCYKQKINNNSDKDAFEQHCCIVFYYPWNFFEKYEASAAPPVKRCE